MSGGDRRAARTWCFVRTNLPREYDHLTATEEFLFYWLAWLDVHDREIPRMDEVASEFGRHHTIISDGLTKLQEVGLVSYRRYWTTGPRGRWAQYPHVGAIRRLRPRRNKPRAA